MSDQPTVLFHDGNSIPQVGLGVWQGVSGLWADELDVVRRVLESVFLELTAPADGRAAS